jgi:hypothetical protein
VYIFASRLILLINESCSGRHDLSYEPVERNSNPDSRRANYLNASEVRGRGVGECHTFLQNAGCVACV